MNLDKFREDIARDEGLRLKPYTDTVGKITIGYGRNLDDKGITQREADYLREDDIADVQLELDNKLRWWRDQPEHVQRGLANLCYQIGISGLLKFEKMLNALEVKDYNKARIEALDSLWAKQTPERAKRVASLFTDSVDV